MTTGFPHLDETVVATARYLETVTRLTEDELRGPSLLPGWTRAHLVSHLARNADALARVLHAAQAGEPAAMYDSVEQRDAAIEEGAGRSRDALVADAVASAGRWEQAVNGLHVSRLDAPYSRVPGAPTQPVRRVGTHRWVEVEVHHADLDAGSSHLEWPPELVDHLLHRRAQELTEAGLAFDLAPTDRERKVTVGKGGDVVAGAAADLVWWLIGRGSGEELSTSGHELPRLGAWT